MRVYTWLQLFTVLGNIPVSAALLAGHQAARLRSAALERSIPGLLSPPLPPSLAFAPAVVGSCVCVRACTRARRIRQHAGTAFPKESSALSFVPILLPLSLSLSAVIKRAGTICPFRQFIASCLFFYCLLSFTDVRSTLFGWWWCWCWGGGGLLVLTEFVVASSSSSSSFFRSLLSFSSFGGLFLE